MRDRRYIRIYTKQGAQPANMSDKSRDRIDSLRAWPSGAAVRARSKTTITAAAACMDEPRAVYIPASAERLSVSISRLDACGVLIGRKTFIPASGG